MDSVPTHIIRRQILEFRGVREGEARQLQEEIGELFREKILPILDRYMSEFSPADVIHRIDRLELDIGTVFRDRLDKDFVEKIIPQLEIYFRSERSSIPNFKAGTEEIPPEKSHLEIFGFFVETGNLPWWVDFKNNDPVKTSLDFLIQNEESALRDLMYKSTRKPDALRRIVIQTGFPKWAELAATNLDSTGKELASMLSQLMDLLRKITPWSNYPDHKLQEIFGLKFLPWAFLSARKTQTTPEFWNDFLIQLTRRPTKFDDSFADLFLRFEKNKQARTKQESDSAFSKEKTPRGSLQAKIFERIELLLEIEALSPEKKIEWLGQLQKLREQAVEDKELREILQLLERETEALDSEKKIEWLGRLQKPDEQDADDKDQRLPEREISDAAEELDRAGSIKKENQFSDADELFVNNAGLVILHPFLNRFFENLNLLVDRRFANVAAAHRAVGLLQFLADGREIPAEHRCGLNKILCGLDAETVLEFGEPVTAEEAEVCQTLLEAVIANAPILREMSVEGFRGSFLIRNGILRAGVGMWQLNVERETFDVVLERFPWNWSVVKLPWMKWAISVEW